MSIKIKLEKAIMNINSDSFKRIILRSRLKRLRNYMALRKEDENKYYLPPSLIDKIEENIKRWPTLVDNYLDQTEYIPRIDGKIPKEIGKKLERLSFDDNYVVGRHIGGLTADEMLQNNFNFRYKYNDITSTVVFNKSLTSGIEEFLLSDLVKSCHSYEAINSYKSGKSVTIFAFPKTIFKEKQLPIWLYDDKEKKYYLVPQFILGSFSYDDEKKEVIFIENPSFDPNFVYKEDGLVYDETQEQIKRKENIKNIR